MLNFKRFYNKTVALTLGFVLTTAATSLPMSAMVDVCAPTNPMPPSTQSPTNPGGRSVGGKVSILQAELTNADKEFAHPSFTMHHFVKASVTSFGAGNDKTGTQYQELWYHNGKPLGLVKNSSLDISAAQPVVIKIVESPCPSDQEHAAAANVIMRLVLDVLLKRANVVMAEVPDSSYFLISEELQKRSAMIAYSGQEPPPQAKVLFTLASEHSGQKQTVYFF